MMYDTSIIVNNTFYVNCKNNEVYIKQNLLSLLYIDKRLAIKTLWNAPPPSLPNALMAFFFNPFINIGGPSIDGKNHPL